MQKELGITPNNDFGLQARRKIKRLVWGLLSPIIIPFLSRYMHDSEYASNGRFNEKCLEHNLLVASLQQDYGRSSLGAAAKFIANHAGRKDLFTYWQDHGFSLIPQTYLSPIPRLVNIPESLWQHKKSLVGINMNLTNQEYMLMHVFPDFTSEWLSFGNSVKGLPVWDPNNKYFSSPDAEVLYSFIRYFKPRQIIEVGSGYSTQIIAQSCYANIAEGHNTKVIAIDPQPRSDLTNLVNLIEVRQQKIENTETKDFLLLNRGDILFIDSSHVVCTGGDVVYEILEVLPQLKPGVIVHFHDIFLPNDYPRSWVLEEQRLWTEQYLLHAFLLFNKEFEVLWSSQYMSTLMPKEIEKCFGKTGGGSFWIRRHID